MGNISEKWNMDSTLGFPLQSLPYNLESITRQQKFAHISSRTVNKNVKLGVSMLNSQDDQGGPSRSSGGSVTPSRRPHRLPDNLNRELEMRKLGPGYSWLAKRTFWFWFISNDCNQATEQKWEELSRIWRKPRRGFHFWTDEIFMHSFSTTWYLTALKVGGSGRKKPGVLTDNLQRQRFELILFSSSLIYNVWSTSRFIWSDPLQVSLQLRRGKGKEADGKYQEGTSEEVERFRKQERLPFLSTMHVECRLERFCILLHKN